MRAALALVLLGAAGCATVEPSRLAALEARVQEQEDVEAIRTVIYDYGRYLDARDIRAYADLFAEDGELVVGMGGYQGREAIYEGISAAFGPSANVEWTTNFHVLSNATIEVDGDTASAITRWMFTRPGADGAPQIILAGRYVDELAREDGRWLIKRRESLDDMALEGFP